MKVAWPSFGPCSACRTTRLLPLSFYGGARKNVGWMGAKLHFSRRMEKSDGNMTDPRHEEFWLRQGQVIPDLTCESFC